MKIIKKRIQDSDGTDIPRPSLAEAVVIRNSSTFVISNLQDSGKVNITLSQSLEINSKQYEPSEPDDYPYLPYTLNENDFTFVPNPEELYQRVFEEVETYVDIEDEWKHFLTACILFSYRQDQSATTPYVFIIGDNDSGKSTILHLMRRLAYRPLLSESLPPADIYHFLGIIEEASGTLLEDEAQGLDEQWDKMKIYKGGYTKGSRIPRIKETKSGQSKINYYHGYCFKVFAGEQLPHDNGLLRRSIVIQMVEGFPQKNIKSGPPSDSERLSKLRNDLLLWRMHTAHQPLPDIKIDFLKNRDEEIWLPLFKVISGLSSFGILENLAKKQIRKRLEERIDSLEATLYKLVKELLDTDLTVSFDLIWNKLLQNGRLDSQNQQTLHSNEYGKLTKTQVGCILAQKLGGIKYRSQNKRLYKFNKKILERLELRYGLQGLQSLQESLVVECQR